MNVLAIDNSTVHFSIALSADGKMLQKSIYGRGTAEEFTMVIDSLLSRAKLAVEEIDLFVMGTGPGSFTGLRTSLSIIKGFYSALDKPCIGIPSYAAIVRQYSIADKPCAVIFDAKKSKVYGGVYRREGDKTIKMIKEEIFDLDYFLVNRCGSDYVFAGESIEFIDDIRDTYPFADVLSSTTYPEARFLIDEALQLYEKDTINLPDDIELLYIHPDTCNVRM